MSPSATGGGAARIGAEEEAASTCAGLAGLRSVHRGGAGPRLTCDAGPGDALHHGLHGGGGTATGDAGLKAGALCGGH